MTGTGTGRAARAILLATVAAGTLDIGAAILTNPQVPAQAVLQSVASGSAPEPIGAAGRRPGWGSPRISSSCRGSPPSS